MKNVKKEVLRRLMQAFNAKKQAFSRPTWTFAQIIPVIGYKASNAARRLWSNELFWGMAYLKFARKNSKKVWKKMKIRWKPKKSHFFPNFIRLPLLNSQNGPQTRPNSLKPRFGSSNPVFCAFWCFFTMTARITCQITSDWLGKCHVTCPTITWP